MSIRLCAVIAVLTAVVARPQNSAATGFMGGTVSVEELRSPLTGKSLHTIHDAQRELAAGRHEQAMEILRRAMDDPSALPYAISMLGVEHLKTGHLEVATRELEEAVRLLPGHAENHANLAYALWLAQDNDRGIAEARKALQLDPAQEKTRLVMGLLLAQRGSTKEAVAYLQSVAGELSIARRALAEIEQARTNTDAALGFR